MNLRYELARLRADYYLSGVTDRHRRSRPVPAPLYVVWDCTRHCNLRCAHCGAAGATYPVELSAGQVRAVLDQLAAMGVRMFGVTGGEPLLRAGLVPLLEYARALGLRTGIATNGFLLDVVMARQMARAGVHSIMVSLDGPEGLHNEIRGHAESFGRAVEAVRRVMEVGVPLVTVATTVTAHNLSELEALHGILLGLGVPAWRLAAVMPIGRAREPREWLTPPQVESLLAFVHRHRSKRLSITLGENLPYLGKWETRLRSEPSICPVGFTACCLGVDGWVRGCPEMPDTPENRQGSVRETPFAEIWQKGFGRYRNREVLTGDAACAACPAQSPCYGGCWVMREEGQQCIRRKG